MNTETLNAKEDSYFDRNSPWLSPAVTTVIIVTTQLMMTELGVQWQLPNWSIMVAAVVGIGWTAFNCWVTDTVSATVVLLLIKAASVVAILAGVWQALF
jgi:hypothetical protein